jgi:hypothetical protein
METGLELEELISRLWGFVFEVSWFILSLWIRLKIHELKKGKKWVWYETSEPEFKNN